MTSRKRKLKYLSIKIKIGKKSVFDDIYGNNI
jgi:hypothetical protein